ncbi:alpha-D-ribose 1-methylphosphonate 5-triphosphate diphosphatase [Cypionkella sp.]|uniref:alpha-D-ribose 1-methylphosphonate 5-triphosphate diphosphatase n=1 Tax=Cypionkella sp. TaxID=2811411 RepID=UPI002606AEFE|nr:alpha-D-ribose 1-methylphosphonate 5-triphosphate diphosphatase [Cypionkella sp.]MDB5664310.1 hypothetical protein [Cypionkella sp.]
MTLPLPLLRLPPLLLTGAHVLCDGALQEGCIGLAEGRIDPSALAEVDLSGYLILPGMIDMHAASVAPGGSLDASLAAVDRTAAAQGITTAYLAQGWSWEGGPRGPDQAEALMQALDSYRPQALTDLRLQICAQTHLVDETARLIAAVRRHQIGYVVFEDHVSEGLHMARIAPADFAVWARALGKTTDELTRAIEAAASRSKEVPRSLCTLAEAFDTERALYGSQNDPDGETRAFYAMIGASVAAFPLTRRAALAAHTMMSPVVMAAPDVLRGRGQSGNVSALALVADGLCDVLASRDNMPALALAVWALVDRGVMGLAQAWALVSSRPAEILRLADRGMLEPGLRADMVIIQAETRMIEATIVAGRVSYLAGEAARRFGGQPHALRLAAE